MQSRCGTGKEGRGICDQVAMLGEGCNEGKSSRSTTFSVCIYNEVCVFIGPLSTPPLSTPSCLPLPCCLSSSLYLLRLMAPTPPADAMHLPTLLPSSPLSGC